MKWVTWIDWGPGSMGEGLAAGARRGPARDPQVEAMSALIREAEAIDFDDPDWREKNESIKERALGLILQ